HEGRRVGSPLFFAFLRRLRFFSTADRSAPRSNRWSEAKPACFFFRRSPNDKQLFGSLVWCLRSSLNNSGVIPANPGSQSGVARAGIQEFERLLDTGFRRYDGEDLNDLFNELWFQDTRSSGLVKNSQNP